MQRVPQYFFTRFFTYFPISFAPNVFKQICVVQNFKCRPKENSEVNREILDVNKNYYSGMNILLGSPSLCVA